MPNTKTKKSAKIILSGIILAFVILINAPGLLLVAHAGTIDDVGSTIDYATDTNADPKTLKTKILAVEEQITGWIWPVMMMIGGLLDNSLLFDHGMEARLNEIWVPIRNVVNILFVIILVGIALYNVTGIGEGSDQYSIKSILPKIIIGIIAVNFSFLGIKVFLDVINVVTVSIFALPDQVSEGLGNPFAGMNDDQIKDTKRRLCLYMSGVSLQKGTTQSSDQLAQTQKTNAYLAEGYKILQGAPAPFAEGSSPEEIDVAITAFLNGLGPNGAEKLAAWKDFTANYDKTHLCDGFELSPKGTADLSKFSSKNAALLLSINMMKILYYEDASPTMTPDKFTTSMLATMILYLVYLISLIALLAVLIVRIVAIWIAIILSPLLVLIYTVPPIKNSMSSLGDVSSKLIKNAFIPIPIALSMTIGWIMLKAMQSINGTDLSLVNSASSPIPALSTAQDLIIAVGTIAVIWVGVFKSADDSWARGFTSKLSGLVGGLAPKAVTGLAKLTPQLVMDSKGNISQTNLEKTSKDFGLDIDNIMNNDKSTKLKHLTNEDDIVSKVNDRNFLKKPDGHKEVKDGMKNIKERLKDSKYDKLVGALDAYQKDSNGNNSSTLMGNIEREAGYVAPKPKPEPPKAGAAGATQNETIVKITSADKLTTINAPVTDPEQLKTINKIQEDASKGSLKINSSQLEAALKQLRGLFGNKPIESDDLKTIFGAKLADAIKKDSKYKTYVK